MRKEDALVRAPANRELVAASRDDEWQRLWLSIHAREWSSLAIVPAATGAAPDFALGIAIALSKTASSHIGASVHVADASQVGIGDLTELSRELERCRQRGDRVLIALPPLQVSSISLTLAKSADYALLCVLLETMQYSEARKTVNEVGAARFLGSVMLHE